MPFDKSLFGPLYERARSLGIEAEIRQFREVLRGKIDSHEIADMIRIRLEREAKTRDWERRAAVDQVTARKPLLPTGSWGTR